MVTILATDLDMTLVGDDDALSKLNKQIEDLRGKQKLKLVYVTGRSYELYRILEKEKKLLRPDSLITAVGTEIYDEVGQKVIGWPIVEDWNPVEIVKRLDNIKELIKQPESEQKQFKLSYYLENSHETFLLVKNILSDLSVDVLYSMNKYLDVLPRGINKGSALNYLAGLWRVEETNIITCGDSENDIGLLLIGKAIVVGNANSALKDWAKKQIARNIYFAEAKCAGGINEGLAYYHIV